MRKFACLFLLSLMGYGSLAQNPDRMLAEFTQDQLQNDSTKAIAIQRLLQLSQQIIQWHGELENVNKQLSTDLTNLNSSYNELQALSEINNKQLKALMTSSSKNAEQQYLIIRENIIRSARTFELAANVITQLDISIDKNIRNAKDNKLSNPESGVLGFKLSDKIKQFAEESLFRKESDVARFMNSVTAITNSELVRFMSPAPALSMAGSVINLLHGISYNNKNLDTRMISEFERKITPYIMYYEKSGVADDLIIYANTNLASQLGSISSELAGQLNTILLNEKFRTDLRISYLERGAEESHVEFLRQRNKVYNELALDNYFSRLERQYEENGLVNHSRILAEKSFLKDISNNLDKLIQSAAILEFLEREYFNAYNSYNSSKLEALGIVPADSSNREKIRALILETEANHHSLIRKEKNAINIRELIDNVENSKFSIKLI